MPSYFAPLPKSLTNVQPWKSDSAMNLGLVFDKFGDAWVRTTKDNRELEFNPPKDGNDAGYRDWLEEFVQTSRAKTFQATKPLLEHFCDRQRTMIERMGGKVFYVRNGSRFVTGMGRQHPLENGFTWHHTLGTPYLAGSAVKGMFRSWLRECGLDNKSKDMLNMFGGPGQVGELVFFDLLPLAPPQLVREIMTPHYGDYYRKPPAGKHREAPGDWQAPNPISYLAVEAGQTWQFGIAMRAGNQEVYGHQYSMQHRAEILDDILSQTFGDEQLLEGLQWMGLGAKTNIGMGRFGFDKSIEDEIQKRVEEKRKLDTLRQLQQREAAEFESSLANTSLQLKELKTRQRDENWKCEAGDQKMLKALTEFAEKYPTPPSDCLEWIRNWLENIPNYTGVWADPDRKKGKNNDKDAYTSRSVRELVKKLNPRS